MSDKVIEENKMLESDEIILDEAEGVATITFNRPDKMNALTPKMLEMFTDLLDRVRDQKTARALILTGKGRAFCSGADLAGSAIDQPGPPDRGIGLELGHNVVVQRLRQLPIPIVCAVNGGAAGGGCGYALAGDIVIAARSAYFLQPFANIGLVPDVGSTWLLPRLIGKARATGMMMLGEKIRAEQAHNWGLIWQTVDDDALMETARAMARRLADGPTVCFALMRQGIAEALEQSMTQALDMERRHQLVAGRTTDHAEGVAAFLEKRPPRFVGR